MIRVPIDIAISDRSRMHRDDIREALIAAYDAGNARGGTVTRIEAEGTELRGKQWVRYVLIIEGERPLTPQAEPDTI